MTVRGEDDAIADGNHTYSVVLDPAVSADPNYGGRNPADVSVMNLDNDSADLDVSTPSGATSESGGEATFTVKLTSQPTGLEFTYPEGGGLRAERRADDAPTVHGRAA